MSAQVQSQSQLQVSEHQETPTSRQQKGKPPAALQTQSSRRKHGRSSLGNLVSRMLPSRRAERGYTLRNEFKDDGPLAAADLVFGVIEPQGSVNSENMNGAQGVGAISPKTMRIRDPSRISSSKDKMKSALAKPIDSQENPGQSGGNGKAKGLKGLGRLLSLRTTPNHGEDKQEQEHTAFQPEQPPFHLPSFNFEKDTLPLDFQKPSADREGAEISKTQHMFEVKKARREQRRSLIESGDFLGIQGANPRTGYWDISTPTSSSEPSQLSYETKKKLEQQAKDVDKQKEDYELAQERYIADLVRAQSLKEKKVAEKKDLKKLRLKLKQRRYGRWNARDNEWSSVAEPDLSPIRQSVVGSPVRETPPADKLFPMPSGDNPTPYVDNSIIEQQDYFGGRNVSSPPTIGHYNAPVELNTSAPRRSTSIPRKPVPLRRQNNDSSDTILHHAKALDPRPNEPPAPLVPPSLYAFKNSQPIEQARHSLTALLEPTPTSQQSHPFLDQVASQPEPSSPRIREAIATSCLLAMMNQVPILPRLFQNLEDIRHRRRINTSSESLPACLNGPDTNFRNPSTSQLLKGVVST